MLIAYLADYHPLADSTGCVALWRAVIYRALCDACFQYFDQYMMQKHAFVNAGPRQISHANWRFAYDARRFLLADDSGFINICLFADIDPAYLRRRAHKVIGEVDLIVQVVPPPKALTKPYRSQRTTA
jgi:hypothetical protein